MEAGRFRPPGSRADAHSRRIPPLVQQRLCRHRRPLHPLGCRLLPGALERFLMDPAPGTPISRSYRFFLNIFQLPRGTFNLDRLGFLEEPQPRLLRARVLHILRSFYSCFERVGNLLGFRFPWQSHPWLCCLVRHDSTFALVSSACMVNFTLPYFCQPDRKPNAYRLAAVEGSPQDLNRTPITADPPSTYTHFIPSEFGLLWTKQGATPCACAR